MHIVATAEVLNDDHEIVQIKYNLDDLLYRVLEGEEPIGIAEYGNDTYQTRFTIGQLKEDIYFDLNNFFSRNLQYDTSLFEKSLTAKFNVFNDPDSFCL